MSFHSITQLIFISLGLGTRGSRDVSWVRCSRRGHSNCLKVQASASSAEVAQCLWGGVSEEETGSACGGTMEGWGCRGPIGDLRMFM